MTKEFATMILSALILAASLAGQAPSGQAPSALAPRPADKPATTKAATAKAKAQAGHAQIVARKKAKAKAQAIADERSSAAYEKSRAARYAADLASYEKLLPLMQAQQRIDLENQRQMLGRMSDIERNAALNRMVSAMERSAGYVYPGQSPTVGPYTGQDQVPMNPLYSRLIPD